MEELEEVEEEQDLKEKLGGGRGSVGSKWGRSGGGGVGFEGEGEDEELARE